MAKRTVFPLSFDISQDIAGEIPVELLQQWNNSTKDEQAAKTILASTVVSGIAVSSDTAGLSKLTQSKELIEVLAIINRPKEIVYALGKAIGGESIGIWAADNTQMFYPSSVASDTVVSMLLETQSRLKNSVVQIGMGAHQGEFYRIGGGLYGEEADFIEGVAENGTEGGESIISQQLLQNIVAPYQFQTQERSDIQHPFGKIYRLMSGEALPNLNLSDFHYPIPYSEEFYNDLRTFQENNNKTFLHMMNEKYIQKKVVVLVERERLLGTSSEVTLLNDLSLDVMMKRTSFMLLDRFVGTEIKTVGALGIYVFDDVAEAVAFAQEFRSILGKEEIQCKIGIDVGAVIIFDLKNNHKDIAGEPVNLASKMAQDKGELGKIYLTQRAASTLSLPDFQPFTIEVSRIQLRGVVG